MNEWFVIPGLNDRYVINKNGDVKAVVDITRTTGRKPSGKIIKQVLSTTGYWIIYLRPIYGRKNQKRFSVHRLLAMTFIPNPENKPVINHKNSIRTDNRLENIEWATYSENNSHAHKFGGQKKYVGELHSQSILNREQVNQIRAKYKKHIYTAPMLAKEYGVSKGAIVAILTGKTWKQSEQAA